MAKKQQKKKKKKKKQPVQAATKKRRYSTSQIAFVIFAVLIVASFLASLVLRGL